MHPCLSLDPSGAGQGLHELLDLDGALPMLGFDPHAALPAAVLALPLVLLSEAADEERLRAGCQGGGDGRGAGLFRSGFGANP